MECGQEAAEQVPTELHLPCRQRARGGSPEYAVASPGANSMLNSRIKALEEEIRTIKVFAEPRGSKLPRRRSQWNPHTKNPETQGFVED